ncbi:uncharacterized protein [Amphiura filiformis]|uniref:uncharacterized protein n=1 Tax=Amphiura filiformis TaxID=82378 RepID=UPI003B218C98
MIERVLKLMDAKDKVTVPLHDSHYQWFGTRSVMFCDTLVAINPGGQSLVYFNANGPKTVQGWQTWCDYQPILNPPMKYLSYKSSVLSVDGKLFLVGGSHYKKMSKISASGRLIRGFKYWNHCQVYEGNVGVKSFRIEDKDDCAYLHFVNSWSQYPLMIDPRKAFPMVHLDGYLYAIGGEDNESEAMKEAERFSFKDKKWEKIADLPVPCYYACATVYKGKILVYGSQPVPNAKTPAQHDLQMYDPATNQWQTLLTEHHIIAKHKEEEEWTDSDEEGKDGTSKKDDENDEENDDWGSDQDLDSDADIDEYGCLVPKNALVLNGDECFRVVYTAVNPCQCSYEKLKPVVHQLEFDFTGSTVPSVKVGKPESQKLIMPATAEDGTFQIRNNVYVNMQGCVHNTGIRIAPRQKKKVNLGVWRMLHPMDMLFDVLDIQVAKFRFDKKAVFCKRCVKGQTCINKKKSKSDLESESDSE